MNNQSRHFHQASMRHLAAMRGAGPEPSLQKLPFPKDWFDLPQDVLADFGAMTFLAGLNRYHRNLTLPQALEQFEPPLRLRQYQVFKSRDYPRAFVTWAGLDEEAEYRLAVDHQPLRAHEWNSGSSVWIIDLVAPFGHIEQVLHQMAKRPKQMRVRTLWHNKDGSRYRIIEWARQIEGGDISVTSYGVGQFKKLLLQG